MRQPTEQQAEIHHSCRLLREYMELEFTSTDLGFPFSIEHFIDDFVLFCMLIGNDFLPSEPPDRCNLFLDVESRYIISRGVC